MVFTKCLDMLIINSNGTKQEPLPYARGKAASSPPGALNLEGYWRK